MLPDFDDNGNLPPGIHPAALEEVLARFGHGSEEREAEGKELADFLQWARTAGIRRLLVDGSFVTAKTVPNDVDVVILLKETEAHRADMIEMEITQWPFVHVMIAADETDLGLWIQVDFGMDRNQLPRGIVEIQL